MYEQYENNQLINLRLGMTKKLHTLPTFLTRELKTKKINN